MNFYQDRATNSRRMVVLSLVLSLTLVACGGTALLPFSGGGAEVDVIPDASQIIETAPQVQSAPAEVQPLDQNREPILVDPSAEENLLNEIYTRVAPSVVHIQVATSPGARSTGRLWPAGWFPTTWPGLRFCHRQRRSYRDKQPCGRRRRRSGSEVFRRTFGARRSCSNRPR